MHEEQKYSIKNNNSNDNLLDSMGQTQFESWAGKVNVEIAT